MKNFMTTLSAVVLLAGSLSTAMAADEKKANPQQERMKTCNTQAGDKKGDERKAFMSQGQRCHADDPAREDEEV